MEQKTAHQQTERSGGIAVRAVGSVSRLIGHMSAEGCDAIAAEGGPQSEYSA
jgi:hypothetical protein